MGDFVSSQRAGTSGRKLEGLDGEGEVLITRVVDQEPIKSRAQVTARSQEEGIVVQITF